MKEMTAQEMHIALIEGRNTSVTLVEDAINVIMEREPYLNALADMNHHALFEASALDLELKEKGPRSPLHGIPIVLKDNILTTGSMRTTANARVFKDFYAPYDATIVKKLKEAGMIILSKASLSEFAYYMSTTTMPSGFGSLHGQVIHPYDKSMDPLGSSTGSAVAVAANYVPLSIGSETNGSLMSPAMAQSITSIKPTLGLVSRYGIIPVSSLQDTAGPMSRTVKDSAMLLDVLKGKDEADRFTALIPKKKTNFETACENTIEGLSVGILTFEGHEEQGEEKAILDEATSLLKRKGVFVKTVKKAYTLPDNTKTLSPEMNRDMNVFLSTIKHATNIHTFSDIVAFNNEDKRRNLKHGHGRFLEALGHDRTMKDATYLHARKAMNDEIKAFKSLFKTHNVDALITTKITGYPPVSGLPSVIVPAKALKDKTPRSLLFIGMPFSEEILLPLAHTYEITTNKRIPPIVKP
jgi:amidase